MHRAGRPAAFAVFRDLPRMFATAAIVVRVGLCPLDDAFATDESRDAAVDAGNPVGHGDGAILTRSAMNSRHHVIITAMRPYLLAILLLVSACARRADTDVVRPPESAVRTMPNPDGCYMQAWTMADYGGTSDYINGPREYRSLSQMPNNRSWQHRINSVRIGPTAAVTMFTDEDFRGATLQLNPDSAHRQLPGGIAGQIESLRVACKNK